VSARLGHGAGPAQAERCGIGGNADGAGLRAQQPAQAYIARAVRLAGVSTPIAVRPLDPSLTESDSPKSSAVRIMD
jgi:hypothetical protein